MKPAGKVADKAACAAACCKQADCVAWLHGGPTNPAAQRGGCWTSAVKCVGGPQVSKTVPFTEDLLPFTAVH